MFLLHLLIFFLKYNIPYKLSYAEEELLAKRNNLR